MGLAVSQTHRAPIEDRDLIVSFADFQSFALRVHSVAFINVVNAIGKPDAAISVESLNRFESGPRIFGLYTFGSNLPTCLIGDALALFKSDAIIVFEVED